MGLDLGAALSNLANKISGGGDNSSGSANNVGGSGSVRGTGNAGGGHSGVRHAAETAIGEQLSGNGYTAESAKSIEEKARAALDDLMASLGLSTSEEDSALIQMEKTIKDEIASREADKS